MRGATERASALPPARGDSDLRGRTPAAAPADALLEVRDLAVHYPLRGGVLRRERARVRAVDGVSFWIRPGETLGLVGESGAGKSTIGRAVLRLVEPTGGAVRFDGRSVLEMGESELRAFRRRAQIIFQDPSGSLNPRMRVGAALREALAVHGLARGEAAERRVRELLELVGLGPEHGRRYPHQLSGGQRQRVVIARALSVEPELIVCDEPVSALDVSVQAQVLNLLADLQQRLRLAYLFIAHDLGVVKHVSDRIAVLYLGRIVELAGAAELYAGPTHPYTRALLSAAPVPEPGRTRGRTVLRGEMPSPSDPPAGCPFHPRCPHPAKDADCAALVPPLGEKGPGHFAACIKEPAWVEAEAGPGERTGDSQP